MVEYNVDVTIIVPFKMKSDKYISRDGLGKFLWVLVLFGIIWPGD